MKVAVVGAGGFGLAAADALARRGHAVVVHDPGPVPHPLAASTDRTKAVRSDYPDRFYAELAKEAIAGWRAWDAGADEPVFHPDGMLMLAGAAFAEGGFEADCLATLRALGDEPEVLGAAAIARRHPAWAAAAHPEGYFNADGGWVESGRAVARLAAGLDVRRAAGPPDDADAIVVAAGAWTASLVPECAPLLGVRGMPVFFLAPERPDDFRPPAFPPWAADVANTGWYGFPLLADGTVKIAHHGAGRALDPDDERRVADEDVERLRAFLRARLPVLADAPLAGTRLCLYTDTADGHFLIDRVPGRERIVVATGGSGHGFKFVPVLGGIVADVVEGRGDPRAARFAWERDGGPPGDAARAQ